MSQVTATRSLRRRIFAALLAACAGVAIVVTVAASIVYQQSFLADEHEQLAGECKTLASLLDQGEDDADVLGSLDLAGIRATLIASDGEVLYDSLADASELSNHADRPEVIDALSTGTGAAERTSSTAGYVSLYEARLLESGDVLRLSVDRATSVAFFTQDLVLLGVIAAAVVGASWAASRVLAGRLVRPILQIDPSADVAEAPYTELEPLVDRLNESHAALLERMRAIEGASNMRREFTSNVTHELKTPIASISAASELLKNGMVKKSDVPEFAGRIYEDAQRLASLVNDILMLGKLDESERAGDRGVFGPNEPLDLLAAARDVCSRLEQNADEAGIQLRVDGSPSTIMGNPRLVDELISNLVENAIRYNVPGGSVFVWVVPTDGRPCVRVADTGVGIPEADREKVFERFYRVDKGRSREMGGTGLGLAIVKHAAAYHGGDVGLESTLGRGTTVTVTFPKAEA